MDARAIVIFTLAGAVALVFGLVPGLISSVRVGIENFREEIVYGAAARPRRMTAEELAERVEGLAIGGVVLLGLAVVGMLAR